MDLTKKINVFFVGDFAEDNKLIAMFKGFDKPEQLIISSTYYRTATGLYY